MSNYDTAHVDTTKRTVTFGTVVYTLVPDGDDGASFKIHDGGGKQVGTVMYYLGQAWITTNSAPRDLVAAVADAFGSELRKDGRFPNATIHGGPPRR